MHWVTGLNPGTPLCHRSWWAAPLPGELFTLCNRGKGNPQQQDSLMPSKEFISWAKIVWYGVTKIWRDGMRPRRKGKEPGHEQRREMMWLTQKMSLSFILPQPVCNTAAKVLLAGTRGNKTWLLEHAEIANRVTNCQSHQSKWLRSVCQILLLLCKQMVKIHMSDFIADLVFVCVWLGGFFPPSSRIWLPLSKAPQQMPN